MGVSEFPGHRPARLLGGVTYDPSTAAETGTVRVAMTALDTTNLRVTFNGPASGKVMVKMHTGIKNGAGDTWGAFLLGVLDGSTVKLRVACQTAATSTGFHIGSRDAEGIVHGLTPGTSYTWDLAYGCEVSAGNLGWGGPNNTIASDAYGAAIFEVWEVLT